MPRLDTSMSKINHKVIIKVIICMFSSHEKFVSCTVISREIFMLGFINMTSSCETYFNKLKKSKGL